MKKYRPKYTGAVSTVITVAITAVAIGFVLLSTYRELVAPPKVPLWRIRTDDAAAKVDFNEGEAVIHSYSARDVVLLATFRNKTYLRCTVKSGKRRTCLLPDAERLVHIALCRTKYRTLSRRCLELKIGK